MAEMVPVEFWSFLNSSVKLRNPDAFLVAEVYQPHLYRDYIQLGKMDALYDKVDLYDTLKAIVQGRDSTESISRIQTEHSDIEPHMLHFLDNHDEQRIPCAEFAGSAEAALPAMVVSATVSNAPTMLYFGQELGEAGEENAGFGQPTRTSIFDYIGVPSHQRWMNNGAFDGGQSTEQELNLRRFYHSLMRFVQHSPAMSGSRLSLDIQRDERHGELRHKLYGYWRENKGDAALVLVNFDAHQASSEAISVPVDVINALGLIDGTYSLTCRLDPKVTAELNVSNGSGLVDIALNPLASHIFQLVATEH